MSDESRMIDDLMGGFGPEVIDYSKVEPEQVSWLWPGRLPAGKLVVMDGDPSTAKSTLSIDLAATVSTGRPWPDGSPCPVGNVIMLSAEDGAADTVAPRLIAAGADRTRVHGLSRVTVTDDDGTHRQVLPSLPRDIPELRSLTKAFDVRLIIVDVLMAYLSGRVDAHRDQDVRGVLHELADLAEQTGVTILLIRHLNKTTGGSAIYRGGGSIGIVGAARAAFLIARDPEDDNRLIMAATKSNLAATPPALSFRLESTDLGCARIQWETEASPYTADQLLSRPTDPDDRDEEDEAAAWLVSYLEDQGGSATAKEIYKVARADGIGERRLRRMRRRVGIVTERKGFQGGSVWTLADTIPEEPAKPIPDTPGPFRPSRTDQLESVRNGRNEDPGVRNEESRDLAVTQGRKHDGVLGYLDASLAALQEQRNRRPINGVKLDDRLPNGDPRPNCRVCGNPLPDSAIADGFDCHAMCQEEP